MAADFSRVRMNPLADLAGVELKQGGVLLDADFNEWVAVVDRRLRALASDVLGRGTASQTTPGAFKLNPVAGGFTIGRGRLYVDGLLAENHGKADPAQRDFDPLLAETVFKQDPGYAEQPWLQPPPALPTAGRHLVYLDVWQREVTFIEDPGLVETAVGVDTSSRLQTVWQVRALSDAAPASADCGSADADVPGWAALIAPSSGRLTSGTFNVTAAPDPCELPPTGGYTGLENQLYRVEIHDGGQPGAGASFKWSRDNGSVASHVTGYLSATQLVVNTLGRDDVLRLKVGDWVEVQDDRHEFAQVPGEMRQISDVDEALRKLTLKTPLPAAMLPASFPGSPRPQDHVRVRRWDQAKKVFRTGPAGTAVQVQDLDASSSTGVVQVPAAGTTLLLENGVTVAFGSVGSKGFKSGDWWVFAARTADASVELLDAAPPRGTHHHFTRLGFWDIDAGTISDCRGKWPPTGAAHDCGCTACVSAESHAAGTFTIQDAINQVRDAGGGTVCIGIGEFALRAPLVLAGVRSLRLHGQGPGTVLVAAGTALDIRLALALAVEDLAIVSVGQASAVSVRSALGLALQRLLIAVVGGDKVPGAAVALGGAALGVRISGCTLLAPVGIAGPEAVAAAEGSTNFLLAAALGVEDNLLWCTQRGLSLQGSVLHLLDTRVQGNEWLASRDTAVSLLGLGLAGSSARIVGNSLAVSGQGIQCALEGAAIEGNTLDASTSPAAAARVGTTGIDIVPGLGGKGIAECRIVGNSISGFTRAAVAVRVAVADLIVKLNQISACRNGVLVLDGGSGGAVSVENNHLRDIGGDANDTAAVLGIGLVRVATAAVAGNQLLRIGTVSAGSAPRVGVQALAVPRLRLHGNQVVALAPAGDYLGPAAGLLVAGPGIDLDVADNQVARDAVPSPDPARSLWIALAVGPAGAAASNLVIVGTAFGALHAAHASVVTLSGAGDALVIAGARAFVAAGVSAAAANIGVSGSVSVHGNSFAARSTDAAVTVRAPRECLFNDNRVDHLTSTGSAAVVLTTPLAIVSANRVRNNADISIRVDTAKTVAAVANITSGIIQVAGGPLPAPFDQLNLRG
jgi:hypothetical protein